jgi:hypothetical protein
MPNRSGSRFAGFGLCRVSGVLLALCVLLFAAAGHAAPQAKILRIDPRAQQENGDPVLTSVVEVAESKRVNDAVAPCAAIGNEDARYDCYGRELEKPYALYTPFPFPEQNAVFTVNVDSSDLPGRFVSKATWGESQQKPGVGTAWLILVDADKRMGSALEDAKKVAEAFVASLGPNDLVDVMFFNDQQVVQDSKWLPAAQRAKAQSLIVSAPSYPSSGQTRRLLTILKTAASDGFQSLGNVNQTGVALPLHQAMVVLSCGFGGTDPSTTGPGGFELNKYLTNGRFGDENTALPKLPVPIISVYFPNKAFDVFKQNSYEFMLNLANPQIGGFFSIMRAGQGARAGAVVNTVRTRFSKMHIVKWRVSCVAPKINQTFSLVFNNVNPPILGDNSFKDVPVGIDPSTWPLDVNIKYTKDMAERTPVRPGEEFKVFGDFCWGGDKGRSEVYFLPAGQQLPTALSSTDIEKAKRTQQQLIAMGMKGTTLEANDGYALFQAPKNDKVLHGSGKQAVVRLIVFDNRAGRTSGVTADRIIELRGNTAPFPILWVLGGLFALVVILLLVVVILKSGGRKRAGPPPAPVVAGGMPGYGVPAGAGYGPPPGGFGPPGYGAPGYGGPPPGGMQGPAAGYPMPPQPGFGPAAQPAPAPMPHAQPPVSPEFMYGAQQNPPHYGLTGEMAQQGAPPPNPYAQPAIAATRALLQGAAGVFTIPAGNEMRIGRDGAQCQILLTEPRVSGVHATIKLEGGQVFIRDEKSNNGTMVNGNRLAPGIWTPVANGSLVRLGPAEFNVRLE